MLKLLGTPLPWSSRLGVADQGSRVCWMRLGRRAEMGMQGEDQASQGKSRWVSGRKEEGEEDNVTIEMDKSVIL